MCCATEQFNVTAERKMVAMGGNTMAADRIATT